MKRMIAAGLVGAAWLAAAAPAEAARPRQFDMICDLESSSTFGSRSLPTSRRTVRYAFDLDGMDFCIVATCQMGLEEILEGDDEAVVGRHFARYDFSISRTDGAYVAHDEGDAMGVHTVFDQRGVCREAPFTLFPPEAY